MTGGKSFTPVTSTQRDALLALAVGTLRRDRAGWGAGESGLWRCTTQTLQGLERRGLCKINPRRGTAIITAAGRRYEPDEGAKR